MRYGIGLIAALLLVAPPASAGLVSLTDVDCGTEDLDGDGTGDECSVTKYGFSHPNDFDYRTPADDFDFFAADHEDFDGSYIYIRSSFTTGSPNCGPERNFTPYFGQTLVRERTDCVPTADFPTCSGGDNDGAECRWIGTDKDCPGGTCDPTGGCHFEIPHDLTGFGARDGQDMHSTFASGLRVVSPGVFQLNSSTSGSFSENSDPDDPICLGENIRPSPVQGYRFNLPDSRVLDILADQVNVDTGAYEQLRNCTEGSGGCTYARFSGEPGKNLVRHDDNSSLCCTSTSGLTCGAISQGQFPEYPDLLRRDCSFTGRNFNIFVTNDWLFDGTPGQGTWGNFVTDPLHEYAGQQQGLCRNNRGFICEVGFAGAFNPCDDDTCNLGTGTCNGLGTPCASDAECDLDDTCDTRERGFRNSRPFNDDTDGDGIPDTPSTTFCSTAVTVIRGTANQYCHIIEQYAQVDEPGTPSGDPGGDCGLWNFGARPLPDLDCNGVDDREEAGGLGDLCPFLNEYDSTADSDGDCSDGDPGTPCRGDECECGDQNLDGAVNVQDLLGINDVIFEVSIRQRVGDATNDREINVADILGANAEIFVPNSAVCAHVTRLGCGDGIISLGEQCDDGNTANNDGCDSACRNE